VPKTGEGLVAAVAASQTAIVALAGAWAMFITGDDHQKHHLLDRVCM